MTAPTGQPKRLSREARELWRSTVEAFELEARHLTTLSAALEALDRMRQAQELLTAEGLTVTDRYGTPKRHPALTIERDSRIAFLRAMRELGLDLDDPATPRPPSRYRS